MELLTLFLLTLPSLWCMPTEWSQWSTVGSQDGNDSPPGDGGDTVDDLIDGGPVDDFIDGLLDDGGSFPVGPTLGGAALATLAGIAATSGLIKAGIIKGSMVTTGLFGAGAELKDQDHDNPVTSNVLFQNGRLDKGEELTSRTGGFTLLMQEDGNLVISHKDSVVEWATNTMGTGSYFLFQDDGDLVVYDGGSPNKAVWNSGTGGQGGVKVELTEEGFLALHGGVGEILWKSRPHTLVANQILHSGHSMASSNGDFKLSMQGDGDLVLYDVSGDQGVVTWRTGPSNLKFHAYVKLQSDGNLVLRDEVHLLQWESGTKGSGASSLVLRDYGKLELCCNEDGSAIWTNAPENQGISGMKANGLKAHEHKDHGVKSGIEIKAPVTPLKIQDLIDALTVEGLKPFGPGHEPLGNLHLGEKLQGNLNEAVKPPANINEIINSEQMKLVKLQDLIDSLTVGGMKPQVSPLKLQDLIDALTAEGLGLPFGPGQMKPLQDLADSLTAQGLKPFGPEQELVNLHLGAKSQGNAVKPPGHTSEIINYGQMKPGALRQSREEVWKAWSDWSDFTTCSATCGPATKMRERTCNDPFTAEITCQGPAAEIFSCRLPSCPDDVTETKMRERVCSESEITDGGVMCQLIEDIQDCNDGDCPVVNGGWSVWSDFGACSATCGPATKRRDRTCTNSETSDEVVLCQGLEEDVVDCGLADCPNDGGWSPWSDFSACTATCGEATKRRERTCTNPEPSDESLACQGSKEDVIDCGLTDCPIE